MLAHTARAKRLTLAILMIATLWGCGDDSAHAPGGPGGNTTSPPPLTTPQEMDLPGPVDMAPDPDMVASDMAPDLPLGRFLPGSGKGPPQK